MVPIYEKYHLKTGEVTERVGMLDRFARQRNKALRLSREPYRWRRAGHEEARK